MSQEERGGTVSGRTSYQDSLPMDENKVLGEEPVHQEKVSRLLMIYPSVREFGKMS